MAQCTVHFKIDCSIMTEDEVDRAQLNAPNCNKLRPRNFGVVEIGASEHSTSLFIEMASFRPPE